MVLRNQVEWAIHCCGVLAGLPEGRYLATKDLAEFHGVPKEYLSKALQALAQHELVETTLGPAGGYRLARDPGKITFLEMVEAIEGKRNTFECTEIRQNNPCRKKNERFGGVCAVARVMYSADQAWRETLKKKTLADLLRDLKQDLSPKMQALNQSWIEER